MSRLFVFALLGLWSSSSLAQLAPPKEEVCRVVVLNLVATNLPESDAGMTKVLTATLAQQISIDSGCQVYTQADFAEMLEFEATKMACEAEADSCLSEIGAAMGAERVVGGSLSRLGTDSILNARLMNVRSGVVEARAEQVVPGSPEKLRLAAKNLGRQLYGKPVEAVEPSTVAPAATSTSVSPLVYVGAGVGALGLAGVVTGAIFVAAAEADLGTARSTSKDASIASGQTGLLIGGIGLGVAIVGAVVVAVALVSE